MREAFRSSLPEEVREELGRQLARLSMRLLDGLYFDEQRQFLAVTRAVEQLATANLQVPVDRTWSSRTTRPARIVEWGSRLATEESHHAVFAVRLDDGTDAVAKVFGYEKEGGEFTALRRWLQAGKPVATPLSTGTGISHLVAAGDVTHRYLLTERVPGKTLSSWESPVHPSGAAPGAIDSPRALARAMFRMTLDLHDAHITVGRASNNAESINWADRLRYHLPLIIPSLQASGFNLPKRLGQLFKMTTGDFQVHGDPTGTNIISHADSGRWIVIDPRGQVTGARGVDIAVGAVTMSEPHEVASFLEEGLRVDGTLRPEALASSAALYSVLMAGWRNREAELLRARVTQDVFQERLTTLRRQMAQEVDPLIRSTAATLFDTLIEQLPDLDAQRQSAEANHYVAEAYLDTATSLAREVLGSPAYRMRMDDALNRNPKIALPADGSVVAAEGPSRIITGAPVSLDPVTGPFIRARDPRHPPGELPPESEARYRISIVTPVTRPWALKVAAASIDAQCANLPEHVDIEWVLMADAGVEGMQEATDAISARGMNFSMRVLKPLPTRLGPGPLRNFMLTRPDGVTGHVVCFLDDDDAFARNSLNARFKPFLEIAGIGWTACDVARWTPPSGSIQLPRTSDLDMSHPNQAPRDLVTVRAAGLLVQQYGYFPTWPQGGMYRTDVLRAVGGDRATPAGEDTQRNTAVALVTPGVNVGEVGYIMRQEGQSITRSPLWGVVSAHEQDQNSAYANALIETSRPLQLSPLWTADQRVQVSRDSVSEGLVR